MADEFSSFGSSLDSPAANAAAVTPNDSADLATSARSLWVGGAGSIQITTVAGDNVTLDGVQAGQIIPIRVARVHSTDTTATNIVAIW